MATPVLEIAICNGNGIIVRRNEEHRISSIISSCIWRRGPGRVRFLLAWPIISRLGGLCTSGFYYPVGVLRLGPPGYTSALAAKDFELVTRPG